MRARWIPIALLAILATLLVNQYPLWGVDAADRAALADRIGLAYLVAGVAVLTLGMALHVRRLVASTTSPERVDDLPIALTVLGAGLYLSTWLMELVKHGREDLYVTVTALVVALIILALTVAATLGHRPARSASAETW